MTWAMERVLWKRLLSHIIKTSVVTIWHSWTRHRSEFYPLLGSDTTGLIRLTIWFKGWSKNTPVPQSLSEITLDRIRGDRITANTLYIFSCQISSVVHSFPSYFLSLPFPPSSWFLFSRIPVKSQKKNRQDYIWSPS